MYFKELSKIIIYTVSIIIFAIIGSVFFALTLPSYSRWGQAALHLNNLSDPLPVYIQEWRVLSWLSLVLTVASTIGILINANKLKDNKLRKLVFYTGGLFSWTILPLIIKENNKFGGFKFFYNYLFPNKNSVINENVPEIINNKKLFLSLRGKIKFNKICANTLFSYLVFASSLVGIILMFTLRTETDPANPYSSVLFDTLSYFTQWTNILLFIFTYLLIMNSRSPIFRNNIFFMSTTTYIVIVAVLFWSFLLPAEIFENKKIHHGTLRTEVKTSWLHGVNPFLFTTFYFVAMRPNLKIDIKYFDLIKVAFPYPAIFGIYIYIIPFLARVTIYGSVTNLNPNMSLVGTNAVGNPLIASISLIVIIILFFLFFLIFWAINKQTFRVKKIIKI